MEKKKKSLTKRIIGIVLDVILILMVLYIGITLYMRSTGDPHASIFGITTHVIISGSMEPNISEGDIIVVKHCDKYEIGDVVTYIREDGLSITHRIIGIELGGYLIKGDANSYDDGIVSSEQILGKVIWMVPKDTWIPQKVPALNDAQVLQYKNSQL